MSNIVSFETGEFKEEKTSAWLVAYIKFAEKLDVFNIFDSINVKMKKVEYSVKQKLIVLMLSIVGGCSYTSEINEKLVPDKIAANILGMKRFPDQSQLNELLRRMSLENVGELKEVRDLRTKSFNGIYAFLWLVFITHNLLSNMKCTVFQGTEFETTRVQTIIKKIGSITAEVRMNGDEIIVVVPPLSKLANLFVKCLQSNSKHKKLPNSA